MVEDWVRTSRGGRPASESGRAESLLRRILQRARPTHKEVNAMHSLLRRLERQGARVEQGGSNDVDT